MRYGIEVQDAGKPADWWRPFGSGTFYHRTREQAEQAGREIARRHDIARWRVVEVTP
jgi:hypothetical protein